MICKTTIQSQFYQREIKKMQIGHIQLIKCYKTNNESEMFKNQCAELPIRISTPFTLMMHVKIPKRNKILHDLLYLKNLAEADIQKQIEQYFNNPRSYLGVGDMHLLSEGWEAVLAKLWGRRTQWLEVVNIRARIQRKFQSKLTQQLGTINTYFCLRKTWLGPIPLGRRSSPTTGGGFKLTQGSPTHSYNCKLIQIQQPSAATGRCISLLLL